jgi:hypothetical protein
MMRSKAPLRLKTRTYLFSLAPWTKTVDLWTLGGITNSLQDRGLPCVCPSDNENSEPDIVGEIGEDLRGTSPRKLAYDLSHAVL